MLLKDKDSASKLVFDKLSKLLMNTCKQIQIIILLFFQFKIIQKVLIKT
jgi:hypothetical protein